MENRFLKGVILAAGISLITTVANATPITALYKSTIDLSGIGGANNAIFEIEYTFDSAEPDAFGSNAQQGYYNNVTGTAQIGSDSLSFSSGRIIILDGISGTVDAYELSTGSASGTVLGLSILDIRFHLFDLEGTMFSDDSLPSDFGFLSEIDTGVRLLRDSTLPSGPYTVSTFSRISDDGQFFTLGEVTDTDTTNTVSEPAPLALLGLGLIGLGLVRRRKS